MHELVDLGHSITHAAVGLCRDETRTSEHIGISPAEEGWTVANDNERYRVAALTCNVLQHSRTWIPRDMGRGRRFTRYPLETLKILITLT
jgi:hypothetical protein